MAQHPKNGSLLYHLTAIDNLESIIINDLRPRSSIKNFKDVADHDILQDREKFNLADYTPFHFFAGSPFAGSVQISNPDCDFVFITLKRQLAAAVNFYIIPSHPLNFKEAPLNWNEGFEMIDWELMALRDYSDPVCKEVCMAESIYKGNISVRYFHCIYVKNQKLKDRVEELFRKHNCVGLAFVSINPGMFINND